MVTRLTNGTIAMESTIAKAPQLMGLAMSGVPKKPAIMLPVVRPTPTMKLAHTAALLMRLLYRPQKKGPRNAPASAPQLMDMSWAMNVMELLYCTSAMAAEITTNTTSSPRIQRSWLFSLMFLMTLPLSRSSVNVDEEVRTRELKVLIDAESTSTMTRPTRMSGNPESIVGTIESYTGALFAEKAI